MKYSTRPFGKMQQDFIRHFWGVFAIKTTHFECFFAKRSQRTLGVKRQPSFMPNLSESEIYNKELY